MAYTLDTKLGDVLSDSNAITVMERYVPGVSKNPILALAKDETLRSLLAMPQVKEFGITEEMVTKLLAEINAIKK
jgi:hypothetical protein